MASFLATDFDGCGLELLMVGDTDSGEDVRDFKDLQRENDRKGTFTNRCIEKWKELPIRMNIAFLSIRFNVSKVKSIRNTAMRSSSR